MQDFWKLQDFEGDRQTEISNCVVLDNAIVVTRGEFTIQPFSVFSGLCILDDGAFVGPHCLVRGPVYLGKNSLLGPFTEAARSIISSNAKVYHRNTILDSIVGEGAEIGGHTGTTNRRVDGQPIKVKWINGIKETQSTFGATIGNGANIGASVILLPGTYVPNNKTVHLLGNSDYQISTHRLARI
jgi:NDP-sugar pyrophosphorylase family protein